MQNHKQVKANMRGLELEVDEGLAELLRLIWERDIWTGLSCQENRPGVAWIMFLTPVDAAKFLNIAVKYPKGAKRPWKTMYGRAVKYGEKGDWEYNLHPDNNGVEETVTDDTVTEEYKGYNDFNFSVSIRFPVAEIPRLVRAFKKKKKASR